MTPSCGARVTVQFCCSANLYLVRSTPRMPSCACCATSSINWTSTACRSLSRCRSVRPGIRLINVFWRRLREANPLPPPLLVPSPTSCNKFQSTVWVAASQGLTDGDGDAKANSERKGIRIVISVDGPPDAKITVLLPLISVATRCHCLPSNHGPTVAGTPCDAERCQGN